MRAHVHAQKHTHARTDAHTNISIAFLLETRDRPAGPLLLFYAFFYSFIHWFIHPFIFLFCFNAVRLVHDDTVTGIVSQVSQTKAE